MTDETDETDARRRAGRMSIASLVPFLGEGHERRRLLRKAREAAYRAGATDADTLRTVWRYIRHYVDTDGEAIAVMAEGGWGGWAEGHARKKELS